LKSFFYIFLIIASISFSAYNVYSNESNVYLKYHFAISINPGSNSGYVNYAIIGENNGKLVYTKFITCTEFILIGMGKQFSAANDSAVNIFKYFNIKDCLYKYDSADCKKKKPEPKLFDLWSLRYNRNPFCPPDCVPSDNMLIEGLANTNLDQAGHKYKYCRNTASPILTTSSMEKNYFNYYLIFKSQNGDSNMQMPLIKFPLSSFFLFLYTKC